MTDPVTILATICITTAIAFPVGVAAGRRQERENAERRHQRLLRAQRNTQSRTGLS